MNTEWTKRRENESKEDWNKRVREELEKLHQTILEESVKETSNVKGDNSKLPNNWTSWSIGFGIGICSCLLVTAFVINNQNQQTLESIRAAEVRIIGYEATVARMCDRIRNDYPRQATPKDF